MSGRVNSRLCLLVIVSLFSLAVGIFLHKITYSQGLTHSHSSRKVITDANTVAPALNFPHGNAVRPDILKAPWVSILRQKLDTFPTKLVNIVTGDHKFQSVVLNWLIAALVKCDHPLENVLVLALDLPLYEALEQREIPALHVDPTTVVSPEAKIQSKHSHIWITRTSVYRLISHWGYDVAMYDSDAVVCKNPQALFDLHQDSDLIGSAGTYPFPLGRKWGLTFCMGVALFRHSPRTELLWNSLSVVQNSTFDDQVKLNHALEACDITWSGSGDTIKVQNVEGVCSDRSLGGLHVAVLSHRSICRYSPCDHTSSYIVHRNSRKESGAKKKVAKVQGVWFLRQDWMNRGVGLTGTKWLEAIATTKQ